MSMGAQIRAGAAYVELKSKDSGFTRGLDRASRRLKAFGQAANRVGRTIALAGGAFAPIGLAALKFASDAEESASRFRAVFGDLAQDAGKWADELAKRVGRAKTEVIDSLSSMQSFFLGLGLDPKAAQGMSQSLTELAVDFASFNNLTDDDAMTRFISALSGSSEVVQKYGINLKQAALQEELLRMGITRSWSAITEQEKAIARYNIILRTMTTQGAVGDATRTAGSFANQMKRLRANLVNTAEAIGRAIMPPLSRLLNVVNPIIRRVGEWIDLNKKAVAAIAAGITIFTAAGLAIISIGVAFGVAGFAITGFLSVMAAVGTVIGIVGGAIAALISPIGLVIAGVVALGGVIAAMLVDFTAVGEYLRTNFTRLLDGVLNVFAGIKGAIEKGDIELAFRILGKTLEVVWVNALGSMKGYWADFVAYIFKLWGELRFGLGFGDGLDIIAKAEKDRIAQRQGIENEIKSIEEDLDKLVREGLKPGGIFGPPAPPPDPFDGLTGYSTGQSSAGTAARGTFNNFGLGGLGNPIEKSIEENTKRTAQAVERIEENTRNAAVFT